MGDFPYDTWVTSSVKPFGGWDGSEKDERYTWMKEAAKKDSHVPLTVTFRLAQRGKSRSKPAIVKRRRQLIEKHKEWYNQG